MEESATGWECSCKILDEAHGGYGFSSLQNWRCAYTIVKNLAKWNVMEETSSDTAKWRLNLGKYLDQERSVAGEWLVLVRNLIISSASISHFLLWTLLNPIKYGCIRGEWKLWFVSCSTLAVGANLGISCSWDLNGSSFILDRNATLVCIELWWKMEGGWGCSLWISPSSCFECKLRDASTSTHPAYTISSASHIWRISVLLQHLSIFGVVYILEWLYVSEF